MTNFMEPLDSRKRNRSELARSLKSYVERRDALEQSIVDHDNFDVQRSVAQLSQLHLDRDRVSANLESARIRVRDFTKMRTLLESKSASIFNVFSYFTNEQEGIRAKIQTLISQIRGAMLDVKRFENEKSSTTSAIEQNVHEFERYQEFDRNQSSGELREILKMIDEISNKIEFLDVEISNIDQKVGSLISEYNMLSAKCRNLHSRISQADKLNRDLSAASNSYERRQLHDECERRFGQGRPSNVRSDAQRELRGMENNLSKLQRRISEELKKIDMNVSHVIIDGNNTCYNGSSFIRLHALTHLVDELSKRYRVTVIFDASIRNLLRKNDSEISIIIGQSAKVHVAPTKNAADEFILRLADGRSDTYVISNDRYRDYPDYDAVSSGRLLRFLIADNQIMLNDLDMTVPFGR